MLALVDTGDCTPCHIWSSNGGLLTQRLDIFCFTTGRGFTGTAASGKLRVSPTHERMENMSGCETRAGLATPAMTLQLGIENTRVEMGQPLELHELNN